jgi:acylaminoacyl-peptidase
MAQAAASEQAAAMPPKPREEPEGMEEEARLLEAFSSLPSASRAWAFPAATHDGVRVSLQLSQRNLPANAQRKYLTSFLLNEAVLEAGDPDVSLPVEQTGVLMYAPSPSGRKALVVRAGGADASAVLEVWDRSRCVTELHVPKLLHGGVFNDGWFGTGAAWSPDETKVAYVAEAPPATKTPEWCGVAAGPDGKKPEGAAAPKGWRGLGEWTPDWGELFTGKKPPTLFVLDCTSGLVQPVAGLPDDSSCGQPVWAPKGDALLFVCWEHQSELASASFPQRLGVVYCFNRPCSLRAVAWPQPAGAVATAGQDLSVPLGCGLGSAFSPRFSPDGATLVFLSQQNAISSGTHNGTCTLHSLRWADARAGLTGGAVPPPRTVVDTVWNPASPDDFPGLYCTALPDQPFLPGAHTLLLTTQWRSLLAVVAVDLASGSVTRVTPANGASWSLLANQDGRWCCGVQPCLAAASMKGPRGGCVAVDFCRPAAPHFPCNFHLQAGCWPPRASPASPGRCLPLTFPPRSRQHPQRRLGAGPTCRCQTQTWPPTRLRCGSRCRSCRPPFCR